MSEGGSMIHQMIVMINSGVVDICDTLAVNPTSPLANVDCDGDGQTNATECTNNKQIQ
ncbi:MAG: hypothetical protein IPJ43_17180 [Saprospiraceae bacterium]|nr:hypothetical protein [Saprospiraceae bacterium]